MLVKLWRMVRPVFYALAAILFAYLLLEPWVFPQTRRVFNVHPGKWVEYVGTLFVAVWVSAAGVHTFLSRRLDNTASLAWPFILVAGSSALLGLPLMLFGQQVHDHTRLLIDRAAFERYLSEGGDCPALTCLRDESGVTAFVWAANDRTWSGVCLDPSRAMRAALRARREDARAKRRPQPRVFGAEVQRADGLWGEWVACAASTRRIAGSA